MPPCSDVGGFYGGNPSFSNSPTLYPALLADPSQVSSAGPLAAAPLSFNPLSLICHPDKLQADTQIFVEG